MGKKFAPFYANKFMADWEESALTSAIKDENKEKNLTKGMDYYPYKYIELGLLKTHLLYHHQL